MAFSMTRNKCEHIFRVKDSIVSNLAILKKNIREIKLNYRKEKNLKNFLSFFFSFSFFSWSKSFYLSSCLSLYPI